MRSAVSVTARTASGIRPEAVPIHYTVRTFGFCP
jgi:hypothetical protein